MAACKKRVMGKALPEGSDENMDSCDAPDRPRTAYEEIDMDS